MTAVSVLVPTLNPGASLPGLIRSVDAQTLPVTDFELVVVDASEDGSAERLQQLAGRRPNVTVLAAAAERSEAERLELALERATGDYVVVVTQQRRLAPRALELLLDRAAGRGADVVLGRVVTATASGSSVLADDAERPDLSDVDLTGCLVAIRRSLAAGRPEAAAALLDPTVVVGEAGSVSAIGRYACAMEGGAPAASDGDVSLAPPTYGWDEGVLQLTIGVRLSAPAASAPRAWLIVRHELAEVAVPAAIGPEEADRATLAVSAVLDPGSVVAGSRLDDGPWDLLLRLAWPDREVTLPLAPGPTRSAVVDGRPYVVGGGDHVARLDAGATRSSVIGAVQRTRTSIAESVQGTLVTLEHPDVHVHGDAVLTARLLLDRFGLPARLVCEDGHARLEAYVGSLAGVYRVSVVAGGGKPVQTGLRLQMDGTGGMTFEDVPPSKPRPTSPAPAIRGPAPLAQRLRRRLPGALDPVMHRLVRVPVIRRTYRWLINR